MKHSSPTPKSYPIQKVVPCKTHSAWLQKDSSQQKLLLTPSQFQLRSTEKIIRKVTLNDIYPLYELYKIVARVNQGNLTQEEDEITLKYISEVVKDGQKRGLILVVERNKQIIAYLKAFTSPFRCLAHVLTNTTMMVHPEWQGKGYGNQLMDAYLDEIKSNMPHILRFELLPHQSNQRAIKFYERHGFVRESLAQKKIRNPKGNFDSEVMLVWFNPNFSEEGLKKYHAFLSYLSRIT